MLWLFGTNGGTSYHSLRWGVKIGHQFTLSEVQILPLPVIVPSIYRSFHFIEFLVKFKNVLLLNLLKYNDIFIQAIFF